MHLLLNMFEIKGSHLDGCFEIIPNIIKDNRGSFVKVFHHETFADLGLENRFVEEYYSKSYKGVIRGLHFQVPPEDHVKLVYCISGNAFDVIVDLRIGSPTYGQFDTFNLCADKANIVYIPTGIAHGFCSLSESSTLVYKTSTMHNPSYDKGVLWNSIDIDWPEKDPVISKRDKNLIDFKSFKSPFYV